MKNIIGFFFGCMAQISACAKDIDHENMPVIVRSSDVFSSYFLTENLQIVKRDKDLAMVATEHRDRLGRRITMQRRVSPMALAIGQAAKKDFIERGIEMSVEALIQCQKETSPVLTTAYLRSDSQQAHCFRF